MLTKELEFDQTKVERKEQGAKITPINQESPFNIDELFVSVTDPLSTILYGNDVFCRVAKYDSEDLIGHYHNLIRHPDMPKAAFRILWDYLLDQKPVAVYVKNMASDGSYYWVIALAFPVEEGYMSIRLKPTSPLFAKVKEAYRSVLAYEEELATKHDREYTIQASKAYLIELLRKEGFKSYDHFMKYALMTELHEREKTVQGMASSFTNATPEAKYLSKVNAILGEMVLQSDKLELLHEKLLTHSNFILQLSKTILSIAINARLQSSKLDQADQSLSVISEKMGEQTQWGEENLKTIIEAIDQMYTLFGNMNFNIISAKLQVEMSLHYLTEYYSHGEEEYDHQRATSFENINAFLKNKYQPRLRNIHEHISDAAVVQNQVRNSMKDIEKYLTILRFIYITGKVEITRMTQKDNSFLETFEDLIQELENADGHLSNLRSVINENSTLFTRYSILSTQLRELH